MMGKGGTRKSVLYALLAFLLTGFSGSLMGQVVYYVASVSGKAEVYGGRWGKRVPLRVGMKLQASDSLSTDASAHVLLLDEDGIPYNLCANCKGTVKSCIVQERPGSHRTGLLKGIVEVLRNLALTSSGSVELVSGSARGAGQQGPVLVLLSPRNTAVRETPVTLEWLAQPKPDSQFQVSVYRGTEKIWTFRSDSTRCQLPRDLVEPGISYFWMVRAQFEDTILEKSASFRLLPEDSLSMVRSALDSAKLLEEDPYLKSLVLASFGLYADAFRTLQGVCSSENPAAKEASRDIVLGLLGQMGVTADEIGAFGIRP